MSDFSNIDPEEYDVYDRMAYKFSRSHQNWFIPLNIFPQLKKDEIVASSLSFKELYWVRYIINRDNSEIEGSSDEEAFLSGSKDIMDLEPGPPIIDFRSKDCYEWLVDVFIKFSSEGFVHYSDSIGEVMFLFREGDIETYGSSDDSFIGSD